MTRKISRKIYLTRWIIHVFLWIFYLLKLQVISKQEKFYSSDKHNKRTLMHFPHGFVEEFLYFSFYTLEPLFSSINREIINGNILLTNDIEFHVCLAQRKMRNEIGRTANMRHGGTAGGGIVETRKIVALLRRVLRSANRHVPERRNQFIIPRSRYRCRAFRSETRGPA